jgi:cholesterol oxidase
VRWYTLSHAGHGDRDKAFILEDASYGAVLALSIDRVQPRFLSIKPILEILRHWITQWVSGKSLGRLGWAFAGFLNNDVSYNTAVLLCMGRDRSNGVMSLDRNHQLTIDWPFKDSMSLYQAILNGGKEFAHTVGKQVVYSPSHVEQAYT